MTVDPQELGQGIDDWAHIPAKQAARMARSTASVYPVNSKEWQDWTALSDRYERQAQEADKRAREIHGWEGDDS